MTMWAQVLTIGLAENKQEEAERRERAAQASLPGIPTSRSRPARVSGGTPRVHTPLGPAYVPVSMDENQAKFSTMMAGNDMPDFIHMFQGWGLAVRSLPQCIESTCADLTAYLSGDEIRAFPNLAAIPPLAWKQALYHAKILALPLPAPASRSGYRRRKSRPLRAASGSRDPRISAITSSRLASATSRPSRRCASASALRSSYLVRLMTTSR